MKEYENIDTDRYDYENIVEDDIWKYKVHLESGIKEIDAAFYMEEIYNKRHEKGLKPWFISIVFREERTGADHTLYLLKSLYFLKRDRGDEVNVGIIYTDDELVREAFEY